jgi:hypothetical protein
MKKYNCEKNDQQCNELNTMLQSRKTIILNENIYNNVFLHFITGFFIIFTLININTTIIYKKLINIFYLLFGGFLGWVFSDTISYFVHLFIDSDYYTSLISNVKDKALVDSHHTYTLNYSYLNNIELIMITYPIFLPILFVLCIYHFIINKSALKSPFYIGFFIFSCLLGLMGGYCHKWAHERNHNLLNNSFIKFLQDYNIILTDKAHKLHHGADDENRYSFSLVNGSSQIVLDPLLKSLNSLQKTT